jgi:hypothetical protein
MNVSPEPSLQPIEVDRLSYLVRAQKFRISATVMRKTAISLATEYAVRLVHLVPGVRPEDIAAYFDFGVAETRVLIQDLLESQLVAEKNGGFFLSARGESAVSPVSGQLQLFEIEEITPTQGFDLVAFAPIDDVALNLGEARLIPELPIQDRQRAANATAETREAFSTHFHEWRRWRRRDLDDETTLHSIEDIQPLRVFSAAINVSVRCRVDDFMGTEPDFSDLLSRGRHGSRNALVQSLSASIQSITAPSDYKDAFTRVRDIDGGIFASGEVRDPTEQATWAKLVATADTRMLHGTQGPGVRLIGTTSSDNVRTALLEWAKTAGGQTSYLPKPVIWLPPNATYWGRSLSFATLVRELAAANLDGTILLARTDGSTQRDRVWKKFYGPGDRSEAVFDRGFGVRTDVPDALEIILKPDAWALVLIHAPDKKTGYPLPIGYVTSAPSIVAKYQTLLSEVTVKSPVVTPASKAFLWHRSGERPERALADLDHALGIEAA